MLNRVVMNSSDTNSNGQLAIDTRFNESFRLGNASFRDW